MLRCSCLVLACVAAPAAAGWAGGSRLPSHPPASSVGLAAACVRSRPCALLLTGWIVRSVLHAGRREAHCLPRGCHQGTMAWPGSSPLSAPSVIPRHQVMRVFMMRQAAAVRPPTLLGAAAEGLGIVQCTCGGSESAGAHGSPLSGSDHADWLAGRRGKVALHLGGHQSLSLCPCNRQACLGAKQVALRQLLIKAATRRESFGGAVVVVTPPRGDCPGHRRVQQPCECCMTALAGAVHELGIAGCRSMGGELNVSPFTVQCNRGWHGCCHDPR